MKEVTITWPLFVDIYQYENGGTRKQAEAGAKKKWGKNEGIDPDSLKAVLAMKKKSISKTKRKPSAYNMFMAKEMKKGLSMSDAASKWRAQK